MAPHSEQDLDNVHANVLRVLREVGLKVEHEALLDALRGIGAEIDLSAQVARFAPNEVEALLAEVSGASDRTTPPQLSVRASLYEGQYLDPETDRPEPMDMQRACAYFALASVLPHVNGTMITGWPMAPRPELEPLLERFYCWKLGAAPSGILYPATSAEHLLELYQAYADLKGASVEEVFRGGVFMQSPLRFSREEASQFAWWWSRGFKVDIAHMTTAGLTAPVTPAGLVTVHLAEAIAIGFIMKACYGKPEMPGAAMLAPLDMRSQQRPYGRPDMTAANLLYARMADRYGLRCFLHSGLTDAARPSCEAGTQKAMSSIAALMAGADAMIDAGLLGGDRIFSPIQMILDNEFAGALKHMLRPSDCSDAAIGFDAMAEAAHEELFTGLAHTAERFREAIWEPAVWTRDAPGAQAELTLDIDRAREQYPSLMAHAETPALLSEEEEQVLQGVIG